MYYPRVAKKRAQPEPEQIARGARKADVVADDVMRRIVRGELPVGSILPKEDELAAHYAVNRSVIREAVKLLEVHLLVRPVRRRGTEVLDPMRSLSPEVLRALLSPRPGAIDRRMLEGLLEVRAYLDVKMSVLAAARRTKADVERLDRTLAYIESAKNDSAEYARRAPDLAIAVAEATQNPVFVMLAHWNRIVNADLDELFRIVRPAIEPHFQGLTVLVELIRKKDERGVEELVRAFHAWASPRLVAAAELSRDDGRMPTMPPIPTKPKPTTRSRATSHRTAS
jgi:DNA-binding FadR family transcriptional regulator